MRNESSRTQFERVEFRWAVSSKYIDPVCTRVLHIRAGRGFGLIIYRRLRRSRMARADGCDSQLHQSIGAKNHRARSATVVHYLPGANRNFDGIQSDYRGLRL
jgi:hypothetical protein